MEQNWVLLGELISCSSQSGSSLPLLSNWRVGQQVKWSLWFISCTIQIHLQSRDTHETVKAQHAERIHASCLCGRVRTSLKDTQYVSKLTCSVSLVLAAMFSIIKIR